MSDTDSETATGEVAFHATVEKGNRIIIPMPERTAAGIAPGDLVAVRLRKAQRAGGTVP